MPCSKDLSGVGLGVLAAQGALAGSDGDELVKKRFERYTFVRRFLCLIFDVQPQEVIREDPLEVQAL
jgi:hypothetical protein